MAEKPLVISIPMSCFSPLPTPSHLHLLFSLFHLLLDLTFPRHRRSTLLSSEYICHTTVLWYTIFAILVSNFHLTSLCHLNVFLFTYSFATQTNITFLWWKHCHLWDSNRRGVLSEWHLKPLHHRGIWIIKTQIRSCHATSYWCHVYENQINDTREKLLAIQSSFFVFWFKMHRLYIYPSAPALLQNRVQNRRHSYDA